VFCSLHSCNRWRLNTRARPARGARNIIQRVVPIIVYVDDQPIGVSYTNENRIRVNNAGDVFQGFALQDLYRIETYEFGGRIVRAHTVGYIQRMTGHALSRIM
jgi:hypothetical protein